MTQQPTPDERPVDTRGLGSKFHVQRTDGDPQGKHPDCCYFVLDLTHDVHARAALGTYIEVCALQRPVLASDLLLLLEHLHDERLVKDHPLPGDEHPAVALLANVRLREGAEAIMSAAQAGALTERARGDQYRERQWLDLCILAERVLAIPQTPQGGDQ